MNLLQLKAAFVRLKYQGAGIKDPLPADFNKFVGQIQDDFGNLDVVFAAIEQSEDWSRRYQIQEAFLRNTSQYLANLKALLG